MMSSAEKVACRKSGPDRSIHIRIAEELSDIYISDTRRVKGKHHTLASSSYKYCANTH